MTRNMVFLGIGAVALSGCSAVTSSVNIASEAANTVSNVMSKASRGTTNASVTEPDTPRYAQAVAFVASQRAQLRREAATGGGEHVATLARLLADTGEQQPSEQQLGAWLQGHYDQIFDRRDNAEAIVGRITTLRG